MNKELFSDAPPLPGSYLLKDSKNRILYVGKAKNIRKRVTSYLRPNLDTKTKAIMLHVARADYVVTDNEVEALVLEQTLIKKHRPRYNSYLKDDKKYPYIKIEKNRKFPRICTTRIIEPDGSQYYGPYTNAGSMKKFLKIVERLFGLRTCRGDISNKKPCLLYHIKKCVGPCTGDVSEREYVKRVAEASLLLQGKTKDLIKKLTERMQACSKKLQYEEASRIRDVISTIEDATSEQKMEVPKHEDADILGYAKYETAHGISALSIRGGRVIAHLFYRLGGRKTEEPKEALSSFIKQHYGLGATPPKRIIVREPPEDANILMQWLSEKKPGTKIVSPKTKRLKRLIALAEKNAYHSIKTEAHTRKDHAKTKDDWNRIGILKPPTRIEGYDISTFSGKESAGSMVVFQKGKPHKKEYRRFKIKTVSGLDDPKMIKEVLARRLTHTEWKKPDIILVDGGLGQLGAAIRALTEAGENIPTVALAKREEEVYVPGKRRPVRLPRRSHVLTTLIQVRDEAHRFAVGYHRKLRRRKAKRSLLDKIPGVGEKTKKKLLNKFGSVEGIKKASIAELTSVPGVTEKKAIEIKKAVST